MIVIDANYVLRWFLNDVPEQARIADKLIMTAAPASVVIDRVTIAEITYILRSKRYSHRQIYQLFEELYYYASIAEPSAADRSALELYRDTSLDFEDCVLVAHNHVSGYSVASFDKDLCKRLDHRP